MNNVKEEKKWFCIDTRYKKPSRPAMYSIIYDALPGETTGQRVKEGVIYIPLISSIARGKSLALLIRQYEAGLDLQLYYKTPRSSVPIASDKHSTLIKGITDAETIAWADAIVLFAE